MTVVLVVVVMSLRILLRRVVVLRWRDVVRHRRRAGGLRRWAVRRRIFPRIRVPLPLVRMRSSVPMHHRRQRWR